MRAEVLNVERAEVLPVEQDRPPLGIVEAEREVHQGGLAGPGLPNKGDGLARLDAEGEAVWVGGPAEDPLLGAVRACAAGAGAGDGLYI